MGKPLEVNHFPDGTIRMNVEPLNLDHQQITWLYDNDSELFQLIALTKHLRNAGVKSISLNLPYIPNARMDRTKQCCEVFTLKAFAETINWLNFDSVNVYNPHSAVSEALFDRVAFDFDCVYVDVKMALHFAATDRDVVLYFPDEGACKRYSDLLAPLGLPVAFGIKKRDWKTGEIKGIEISGYDELKGKNILLVDDICAYGGTAFYSAIRLKELGANKINCYFSHLENSALDPEKGKLLNAKWYSYDGKSSTDLINTIYTTNSIFRGKQSDKIKIIRFFEEKL